VRVLDEEPRERRVDGERVPEGEREPSERRELEARLVDATREPREDGGLGRPHDRERRARREIRGGHGGDRERDGTEQRREVAVARRETGGSDAVGNCDPEQREALAAAVEDERGGVAGEGAAPDDRRRGEAAHADAERVRDAGDGKDQPERDRDCRSVLVIRRDERDSLRRRGDDRRDRQPAPLAPDRERERRREDESCERGSQRRHAALERDGDRHEHRADQPEAGDRLGPPDECDAGAGRRDPCCKKQRGRRGEEVVERRGGEERRVSACEPGADGGNGGVRVAVAPVQPEPRAEDEAGGERAEADARRRADPAAVDREDEEEDDPEERHCAAGPGERTRAQEEAEVEPRARDPERRLGGPRRGGRVRPDVRRLGNRLRRGNGLRLWLGRRGRVDGEAPQLGELRLECPQPPLVVVETIGQRVHARTVRLRPSRGNRRIGERRGRAAQRRVRAPSGRTA
jgi:hypothetical protein